jgi:tetratricopeptide (TPR) repeat protein
MKYPLILGSAAAIVCFAHPAMAKSPAEIEQIAKSVSVEIITGTGSGVLLYHQGDLYTLITNRHVVCGSQNCTEYNLAETYRLRTADHQIHQASKSGIKFLKDAAGNNLDLAIVQFRSNRSYQVAQVADSDSLKVDDEVYTAGFPKDRGFLFGSGQAKAVVHKRLVDDRGGYTVVYDAETLPGMSGGGAFDNNGRLVAIHGQGDRYTENTEAEVVPSNAGKSKVGSKIGINRGIPVRWVVQGLSELGILVGNRSSLSQIRVASPTVAATADEFFIAGFNKLVDPGEDFQAGQRESLAQFSRAIALNSRYTTAYFLRAYVKDKLNDPQGALADYNQSISLNPKYVDAYNNRGILKADKLNDSQGALADYNQAISLNPKYESVYNNRGNLKKNQLNDSQGALADYNQAISLNPKYADAYYNRGLLKYPKLNDPQGALADYDRAISLNPKYAIAYNNRGLLKQEKLNNPQGALADYDRAISLNPKSALAYNNRGALKQEKLNNPQGALADYNQAISLNPKYVNAYVNRGNLKVDKLNDPQGALADYNQAISLNPKFAIAYYNRGILKYQKLNDRPGAISDFRAAAKIYRQQGQTSDLKDAIDQLRKLGATE